MGQLHLRCQVIIERQLVHGLDIDLLDFLWNATKCPMGPAAAGFGGMFAPGVERQWRKEKFKANRVTHDAERFARAQAAVEIEPRLALAGPTIGWISAAADAFDAFRRPSALANIRVPILVASAGEEKLVDNESHAELARLLANARHITIDGAMHEILMELDDKRARFWSAFDELVARVAPLRALA